MSRLSSEEYWDSLYKPKAAAEPKRLSFRESVKVFLTKVLGEDFLRSYADRILWNCIYRKYLPRTKDAKFLEIGSAPGTTLLRFHDTFGYTPYGIEYAESGAELNKELFRQHSLNPDNAIHADFFSDEFHNKYKEFFDIVYSRGFIEHFTDVNDVIDKHLNLLKKGGFMVIVIPRLKGINYWLTCFFHRETIAIHNLQIMEKPAFTKLFAKDNLTALLCDYYGTFTFDLFHSKKSSPLRYLVIFANAFQLFLNLVFFALFGNRGAESRWFSPYLLYIGIKK